LILFLITVKLLNFRILRLLKAVLFLSFQFLFNLSYLLSLFILFPFFSLVVIILITRFVRVITLLMFIFFTLRHICLAERVKIVHWSQIRVEKRAQMWHVTEWIHKWIHETIGWVVVFFLPLTKLMLILFL
jgi:hypothetical protein